MVEKAKTHLKSVYTRANLAAKIAEIPPIQATTWKASGSAAANMNQVRPTIYTPAATIVAAWISALTGVGPSMAGGSHTWSGTCADLPIAPQKIRIMATVSNVLSMCKTAVGNWLKLNVPVLTNKIMMPMIKPTSPTRFAIKASTDALAGERRSSAGLDRLLNQNPISKYELRPTSSHPIKITRKFAAKTIVSMDKAKRER